MITRRQFLKASVATGVGFLLPGSLNVSNAQVTRPHARRASMPRIAAARRLLTPWLDSLPIPPVLTGADHYAISMEQRAWQFHSQFNAAPSWGYWSGSTGIGYLGPTIVAQEGRPVTVTYTNNLQPAHILSDSIDWSLHSMHGLEGYPESRAVPHLHGGFTEPGSDGHPDAWFSLGESRTFHYSNAQPACMLWYHDHAMGITRLNAYAGLAAAYIIRDDIDTGVDGQGLNIPKGAYEVPIVIQDKMFGSCRFRGVGRNGIALAASRPVIGLRMEVSHDAVSAQHLARRTGML